MRWISVKDKLPDKDESEILVYGTEIYELGLMPNHRKKGETGVFFASYSADIKRFNSVHYYSYDEIEATHWMYKPAPPV